MEQLNAKFSELKVTFNSQENKIQELLSQQDKNEKLLSAFKNELQEIQAGAQQKQETGANITADEYVSLKNQSNDLKARIEYHSAIKEDIDSKIYQEKETLSNIKSELNAIRAKICEKLGMQKLEEFISTQKPVLDEIFSNLYLSNKFQSVEIYSITKEQAIKEFLTNEICKKITDNPTIPQELSTYSPLLEDFTPQTPTARHRAQYAKAESKGLNALLTQLTGN